MIKKTLTLLTILTLGLGAQAGETFHQGPYSAAEKALLKQNLTAELYETDKPSGHMLGEMQGKDGKPFKLVLFNFGIEDVKAARTEGTSMATFNYTPALAQQFLFLEGWDKYHDRFFTRAYVQEGMAAFNSAVKPPAAAQTEQQAKQ